MSLKKPVILWGGVDICPDLYNKPHHKFCQKPDKERDNVEMKAIQVAVKHEIPVVGVCRGAQLLTVFNGGELYQHCIPEEGQGHGIDTYDGKSFFNLSASHHQVMVPSEEMITSGECVPLAWNPGRTLVYYHDYPYDNRSGHQYGCYEALWFPKVRHLAIQPHPEWMTQHPFVTWINKFMKERDIDLVFGNDQANQ